MTDVTIQGNSQRPLRSALKLAYYAGKIVSSALRKDGVTLVIQVKPVERERA